MFNLVSFFKASNQLNEDDKEAILNENNQMTQIVLEIEPEKEK
jgi:hypothetical protein